MAITSEETKTIWVLADYQGEKWPTVTLELLGDAYALAKKKGWHVAVLVFAKPDRVTDKKCGELGGYGASECYVLENEQFCEPNGPLLYRRVLDDFFTDGAPAMVLAPSTSLWVECVSLFMASWDGTLVSEAVSFRPNRDGALEVTRYAWHDKVQLLLSTAQETSIGICLRPDVAGVGRANARIKPSVTRQSADIEDEGRVQVQQLFSPDPSEIDLLEADRIIAGGRGVGGPEGFELLEELAKVLGAGVGATRVTVDLGWVPYSRQIGQTGKTVKPRLYIAVGLSGASQHVDGMSGSEVVIAINNDPQANIFNYCQLGFVGDAKPIIHALMEALGAKSDAAKQVAAAKGSQ